MEMIEVFAVYAAIAEQVAEALNVTVLQADHEELEARPTDDLEAYDLYLLGRHFL
ncbi:MAG: hypothetical protein IIC61_08915, partial [Proteobacteria bacterium]|nr:hypothetical protein [Pseudomonadota bacterium]